MPQPNSNILLPALAALAVVGTVVLGVFYLGGENVEDADGSATPAPLPTLSAGEAPDIRAVDIDSAPVAEVGKRPRTPDQTSDSADLPDLFASNGRRRALRDGLSSEDVSTSPSPVAAPADAGTTAKIVDFFDFGQLDQRLRIGVFGRGPISHYKVRHIGQRYFIDMPGHYRLIDNARNRSLTINALGIETAELFATDSGIRMVIETEAQPRHTGFLIEDARGIMIAFEPRP